MQRGLAPLVEAAYQTGIEESEWLCGVLRALLPFFGAGVLGLSLEAGEVKTEAAEGLAPEARERLRLLLDGLPEALSSRLPEGGYGLLSEALPEISAEALFLFLPGTKRSSLLLSPAPRPATLSLRQRTSMAQIFFHAAAGYRMREEGQSAGALWATARAFEEGFGAPCPGPQVEAIWRDLLAGRLSFVESLEEAGRRLLVLWRNERAARGAPLTAREGEVLSLAALGRSNRQIARQLGLTIGTVITYVCNGLAKLGLRSRLQLIQACSTLSRYSAAAQAEGSLYSPPPEPVRAARFSAGGSEFIVLSFPAAQAQLPSRLTAAERAVVEAALRGRSNAEIAQERGTTTRTVANQLASAFLKLGVNSRGELAARHVGLIASAAE